MRKKAVSSNAKRKPGLFIANLARDFGKDERLASGNFDQAGKGRINTETDRPPEQVVCSKVVRAGCGTSDFTFHGRVGIFSTTIHYD
jgi:hypothetical protein